MHGRRRLSGFAAGPPVLDVSGVSFCDAAGLRALEAARDSAVQAGAEFALAGARSRRCCAI
ncbi:STAS domain-containing protein [Streptomyces sp900105245]|uniref:STAS domain-containing protein n=1 Tax=Streptomyces sp. 900105245 TaxID=3154379 RepID=A0ABV1UJQ5_9ACTN